VVGEAHLGAVRLGHLQADAQHLVEAGRQLGHELALVRARDRLGGQGAAVVLVAQGEVEAGVLRQPLAHGHDAGAGHVVQPDVLLVLLGGGRGGE
jgi:hypothetical protein